jgi:hypothetical protein
MALAPGGGSKKKGAPAARTCLHAKQLLGKGEMPKNISDFKVFTLL